MAQYGGRGGRGGMSFDGVRWKGGGSIMLEGGEFERTWFTKASIHSPLCMEMRRTELRIAPEDTNTG